MMNNNRNFFCAALSLLVLLSSPVALYAMTAQEILDQVAKQNFSEDFRLVLSTKTFKGKKTISSHALWLMGKVRPELTSFFIEFDEPEESKGLRFLLQIYLGKEPKAFMFFPVTGNTLPLAVDDPSVDIGGTGLTMEDMQGFTPEGGERLTLVEEQKYQDRECYVIRVSRAEEKAHRLLWISKKDFIIAKSQNVDAQGKITRELRGVEFFKTASGREFPREEEITMPGKGVRVLVRQEHAVFGIEIPDEIMDPGQFGTYKWKN